MSGGRISPPYLESSRQIEPETSGAQSDDSNTLTCWLEKYFEIPTRGSTIKMELRAGATTFLTMSYILLVNPQILKLAGLPVDQVVVATAVSAGLSSLSAGFFANAPLGLASGVGLSIYLSYGVVQAKAASLQDALSSAFIAGILLAFFTVTGITSLLMTVIPRSVKLGIIAGMGLLMALVGLTSVDIVVSNPDTIVGIGDIDSYVMYLCIVGLCFIGTLVYYQVPGGIIIGIGVMSVLGWFMEGSYPAGIVGLPQVTLGPSQLLTTKFSFDMLPSLISFFFVLIFDLSGVVFGMCSLAGLNTSDGKVPGSNSVFLSAAGGTMLGAAMGCTPIIVYVESAAGIIEGGKTGLTAVTAGTCFLMSIFFSPIIASIPQMATAPVLMLVGAMMMSQVKQIDWNDMMEAVPAFLTIIMMPFTFSIQYGILFGLGSSFCFYLFTGTCYSDIVIFYNRQFFGIEAIKETEEEREFVPLSQTIRRNSLSFVNDTVDVVYTPSLITSPKDAQRVLSEGSV